MYYLITFLALSFCGSVMAQTNPAPNQRTIEIIDNQNGDNTEIISITTENKTPVKKQPNQTVRTVRERALGKTEKTTQSTRPMQVEPVVQETQSLVPLKPVEPVLQETQSLVPEQKELKDFMDEETYPPMLPKKAHTETTVVEEVQENQNGDSALFAVQKTLETQTIANPTLEENQTIPSSGTIKTDGLIKDERVEDKKTIVVTKGPVYKPYQLGMPIETFFASLIGTKIGVFEVQQYYQPADNLERHCFILIDKDGHRKMKKCVVLEETTIFKETDLYPILGSAD